MSDQRDLVERLRYPAANADRRRLMREAADALETLQEELQDALTEWNATNVLDAHERFKRE